MNLQDGVAGLAAEVDQLATELRDLTARFHTRHPDTWTGRAATAEQRKREQIVGHLALTHSELEELAQQLRAHGRAAQANYEEIRHLLASAVKQSEELVKQVLPLSNPGFPTMVPPR